MKVPVEFEALGSAFYAGSYVEGMSAAEWIRASLSILNEQQKRVSKVFLDELLTGNPDGKKLQGAWRSGESDYCFADADLLVFLQLVQEALAH